MRKSLLSVLALVMIVSMCTVPALAAGADSVSAKAGFELVDDATLSGGITRASWGYAQLYCSDPLFSNPQGYAYTSTYAGTAYKITAKISVVDGNGGSFNSGTTTETNASSAESGTITSKTASCTFTGRHSAQDTSSSGWQYADTSKSY